MASSIRDWPNAIGLVRLRGQSAAPAVDVRSRREVPPPPVLVPVSHHELRRRHRSDDASVQTAARRSASYVHTLIRAGHAKRRRRVPRTQWPFALEREYASDLVAILEDLRRQTDAVLGELPALVDSARRERHDAAELLVDELAGLRIVIENPIGSVREWTDADGTTGRTVMRWAYGYLDGYEGADGEDVDVYMGPERDPTEVFVVHQRRKGAADADDWPVYDEDKVMLGWSSADAAKAAYLEQYNDPRFFGGMSVFSVDDFKRRLHANPGRKLTHADPRERVLRADVGEGRRARILMDRARDGLTSTTTKSEHAAEGAARQVSDQQRKQLGRQSDAALGVDITPLLADPKMAAAIDGFVHENVALIKSLGTKTLDELEKLITRAFADGQRADTLGAEIAKRWGIAERHARLIARDQIGKLNGQVTRARHEELGIAQFRWLTMRDPKVRPRHVPMEGKVFSYRGKGAPPFYPGQEICCRCGQEPLFDDIMAELDALIAAPATAPAPIFDPSQFPPRVRIPEAAVARTPVTAARAPQPPAPVPPIEDSPAIASERARAAAASVAARAAAEEDLSAFAAHQKAVAAEEAAKQAAQALAAKKAAAAAKAKATRAANKAKKAAQATAAAAAPPPAPPVPSAIRYSSIPAKEFGGFHGRGFAQDADAIEGGSVRVVKVQGHDGEYFEAVFKVTTPYGQRARAYGTEAAQSWTFRQREVRNGELHDLAHAETMPNTSRIRRGNRSGNTVEIGETGALANQVRVRARSLAELDAAMEDFSKHVGVDLRKEPSRADIELQAKARLAAKFDPTTYGHRMQSVTTPEQQRQVIDEVFADQARKHPVLLEALKDVRLEEVYPGHRTLYSESLGKLLSKQWGAMYHDGNPPAEVAARIVGDTGLMSSVKRYQSGVFTTGMSTSADFRTGGADGVFMRVSKTTPSDAGGRFRAVIDTKKVMGRLDWWAFNFDNYGRAGYREYNQRWAVPDQIGGKAKSGNEVMATHGVPPSAFKKFIVGDESYRRQVLGELRKMGVTQINGTPIDEFVTTR